jgi:hypothetical protein
MSDAHGSQQQAVGTTNHSNSATWVSILEPALALPDVAAPASRTITVKVRTSCGHDLWKDKSDSTVLFNVALRTSSASDHEASLHTAHAAAIDLAAISPFFCKRLCADPDVYSDTRDLRAMVVGLDISQQQLHAIIESLYKKELHLSPTNVEQCLMAAQYLDLQPVLDACSTYLLDSVFKAVPAAVTQLVFTYLLSLKQQLLHQVQGLPWDGPSNQTCRQVLDSDSVTLDEALIVLKARQARSALCSQLLLLDELSAMPRKRCALLPCVSFEQMRRHAELEALVRYASKVVASSAAAWQEEARDGFWARVLANASQLYVDSGSSSWSGSRAMERRGVIRASRTSLQGGGDSWSGEADALANGQRIKLILELSGSCAVVHVGCTSSRVLQPAQVRPALLFVRQQLEVGKGLLVAAGELGLTVTVQKAELVPESLHSSQVCYRPRLAGAEPVLPAALQWGARLVTKSVTAVLSLQVVADAPAGKPCRMPRAYGP